MTVSVQWPRTAPPPPAPPRRLAAVRAGIDRFIHHPATELGLVGLILLSVGLLVAEAALARGPLRAAVERVGDVVTWLFVVELALRWWVAPKKRRFFRRYWLDLLAVVPLARPLRLFRVLRLLRLFRAGLLLNRRLSVFRGVISSAGSELTVLFTATAVLVLAAAVILHVGERGVNGDFAHLDQAVWFSVMSLVAGEPVGGTPLTPLGRAVSMLLMLGGLTVFAMFVGTVSASMVSRLARRMEVQEMDLDELTGHVVICGWNHSGPKALEEIFNEVGGRPSVVVITEGEQLPDDVSAEVPRDRLYHVSGDYTRVEVLEQAAIGRAAVALLLSDKTLPRSDQDRDARTVLAALTVERLAPGIFTCAELRDRQNETLLRRAGVEEIVVADEYSGLILGSVGRNRGLVATLDEILSTRYGNAFHKTAVPPEHEGASIGTLHALLKREHDAVLVSVERREVSGHREVVVNPPVSMTVHAGDELVIISPRPVSWRRTRRAAGD